MPDKRYRQSPGQVQPNVGGGTYRTPIFGGRGRQSSLRDAVAEGTLSLREREFLFQQKKFAAELAENEVERRHALAMAEKNFANDAQLKEIAHGYALKEAEIKQKYAVELDDVQTGNKSFLQNEKAELDSGFSPEGFAKSRTLKDSALGQPGIEELYANDLRSQLMKGTFDNDKVASEAERNRVMSVAPGHMLTGINNVPPTGALMNVESTTDEEGLTKQGGPGVFNLNGKQMMIVPKAPTLRTPEEDTVPATQPITPPEQPVLKKNFLNRGMDLLEWLNSNPQIF